MGADLSYVCNGGNSYTFTLSFYRDCAGISAPTTATLNLSSASCNVSQNISLSLSGTGTEVSPLCPSQVLSSSCNGGSLPGVEQYLLTGTVTLPQACNDWMASYTTCCRNAAITNLVNPSSEGNYIFAQLDNTGGMCNNSPTFTTLPVPYICSGQQFCYNHGAYDVDGDSLVYRLINALDGPAPGVNIGYVAPFSPTYPLTTVSGIVNFDPNSGTMCITPSGAQVAVVVIEVEEYRNGVLIGRTMRDIQIVVRSCTNQQPVQTNNGIFNNVGGVQLDSNSVEVCPGTAMNFNISFQDPNAADNITLTSNIGTVIPGASLTTSGTNPVNGTFSWTPTSADIGFHNFTVTIQDDGCPILGSQVYSFDIRVLDGTYAGPDQTYCTAGSPIQLSVQGGNTFNWSTLSGDPGGLSCTNCQNPVVTPSTTSTYEVVSNLSATCKNRDTITINFAPNFNLDAGLPSSICKYGSTVLNSSVGPGTYAPYSYSWSPPTGLSSTTSLTPTANPTANTTYYLSATSALGCTIVDSVDVNISGVAPIVLMPATDTICPGVPQTLSPIITYECDTSTQLTCTGANQTATIGTGTIATTTYSPNYMTTTGYSNKKQFLFTADELQAQGFNAGLITSVALNYSTANTPASNVVIRMGCTAQSGWDVAPFTYLPTTEVRMGATITPSVGWNTFTFDYPYMWDGASNIVLEFCTNDIQIGTSSSVYYECTSLQYRTLYTNQYNAANACNQVTGVRTTCRPNVRFGFCDAVPPGMAFAWSPGNFLTSTTVQSPTASMPSTTTYTLSVDDGSGCIGSAATTVVIDSTVYVNAVADDATPCVGQVVNLTTNVTGNALPPSIPCGANNTACVMPSTTYTIGSGASSTTTYGPFFGSYSDVKYQFLFRASELQAMGVPSGTISELAWNVITKSSTGSFRNMRIGLGCTTDSDLNTTTGWLPTSNVFGPQNVTTTAGWNTFNLNNTFNWDGVSNLVVEVCFDQNNGTTVGADQVQYGTVGFYGAMRYYTNTNGSNGCNLAATYRYTSRCNMQFTVCPPPPSAFSYSWSPATGLSSATSPSPNLTYTNSTPGTYVVTVSGGRCPVTDTVSLTSCTILPTDALQLYGTKVGEDAALTWTTLNELATDHFILERSADGERFEQIAWVKAAENTQGETSYDHLDMNPFPGMNIYRVTLYDQNGAAHPSNSVEVAFPMGAGILALYPNPSNGSAAIHLDFSAVEAGDLSLNWIDPLGRLVLHEDRTVSVGLNALELDHTDLPAGTYFLRMEMPGFQAVRKVVLSH